MVVLGLMAATDSLGRHFAPGEAGAGVRAFYAVPIADMLGFGTLIYFWLPGALQSRGAQAAYADRDDNAFGRGFRPLAHTRSVVGSPGSTDVLLPSSGSADVLRRVVHWKGSSRHALGQRISNLASTSADTDWSDCALAELRRVGTKSRPFFPLSRKESTPILAGPLPLGTTIWGRRRY